MEEHEHHHHYKGMAPQVEFIDPVCGMKTMQGSQFMKYEHEGQAFYFCSDTCPMHPEVRQSGPGSYPCLLSYCSFPRWFSGKICLGTNLWGVIADSCHSRGLMGRMAFLCEGRQSILNKNPIF